MSSKVSRWLGIGVLALGFAVVPMTALTPAGTAHADTDSGAADTRTSERTESGPDESDKDSDTQPDTQEPDTNEPAEPEAPAEDEGAETPAETPADEPGSVEAKPRKGDRLRATRAAVAEPEETAVEHVTERPALQRQTREVARVAEAQVAAASSGIDTVAAPEPLPAAAAQPAATAARPNLINIVGTLFFKVFDNIVRLFEGPPAVPPGRAVRVARTPLELDCGNGRTVEADWYFPTETTPDKVIYFQHGGFARAGLYNVTAADLAVRNNAIVVAPSITSNFFECAGCQLGGDQMHAAVAKLFLDDRSALTASALAAGWAGELPRRFVIAGHSEGGQLAAGAAGFYARDADPDRVHDLAGVLLLDTSPVGGAVERGVRSIPLDIPVHHISAAPGILNSYGDMDKVLGEIRPGFVGLRLIGGVHADAWQSSNGLGEFVVGLAFGFSQRQNVEAVQVLAQAWISDWFGDIVTSDYYGERGEVIDFDTSKGTVRAYVIPGPAPRLTIIDRILKAMIESTVFLRNFSGNCAVDPVSALNDAGPLLAGRNSTADTALSLDGRRQTGQSVGQQCTEG
ncbi:hypothetical protein V4U86_23225 [Mycobacterium sp. AMU20-3851]|uniref:hypothetical protein n=1 Tax=Mycobacterium sp. AMU20-3851 TaxID=3122055 RepID=UPI0037543CE3